MKSYGQEKVYFERVEKEGGIQLGHIFDLFEGSEGFMWFCTSSGLVKYDGVKFKYFQHVKNDTTSISSSWVNAGIEDSKGRFWIGTGRGLNLMDWRTEKFTHFFHDKNDSTSIVHNAVRDIIEDTQHRIWVATIRGVSLYDEKGGFLPVTMPSFSGHRHTPKLLEDSQGNIWVSSTKGVFRIDPEKMLAKHFSTVNGEVSQAPGTYGCWGDENGKVWVSTKDNGVWIFNPLEESFSQLPLPEEIRNMSYNGFVESPKGFLIIGSFDTGLISWDLEKNEFHRMYKRNPLDLEGPINITTYSLATDKIGNLWVGTFNGVNVMNAKTGRFQVYENVIGSEDLKNYILNINEDQYGGIWLDSRAGLFYKENLNAPPVSFVCPPIKPDAFNGILNVFVDEQKKVWVVRNGWGLYGIDIKTQKIDIFVDIEAKEYSSFSAVYGDNKNVDLLWITSKKGLLKYNKATGTKKWFYPKEQLNSVSSNLILKLEEKTDGSLWGKSSSGGIISFDKKLQKFKHYTSNTIDSSSIIPGHIINLSFSPTGLWIATNKGVSFLKNDTDSFVNYYKNDTLFKYGIASMNVDDNDNVWVTDDRGISKFESRTNTFLSYYCLDKVEGFTYSIIDKSKAKKYIYLGTPKGLLSFHPDSVLIDTITPKTVLTNFTVNNEPFELTEAIEFVDSIFLTPEARVFSFEYAGLYFKNAKKIKFKIKLEGFETDWREVGTKRDATYTNLSPGEYTFLVLNANADGVWSKKPLAVKLFILPPYWQTNWFYALLGLMFLGIVYVVYKSRKSTYQLKKAKAIAEQSDRYKSQFLANMSHEIRTPMNAIVGMSKLMLDTNLNLKQKEYANIVQQSAENLLVIINDILDQSKIESGQYTFVSKAFDLSLLTEQLRKIFNYQVKEKGLKCEIIIEKNVPLQLVGDPTRLNQILMNLIGNAIKFTNEGSVRLIVEKKTESEKEVSLLFSIHDTGVGIDEENLSLIFESFKQLKNNNILKEQGSGLGLSISKELVQKQGGEIWVESEKGSGSCFCFTLTFLKRKEKENKISVEEMTDDVLNEIRFLIVEDILFNQILAIELLKKSYPKAIVDVADNGQVAIEKVRQNNYDLVLMDVKMPVMDGLEATRLIRKMKVVEKRSIPILAVTANAVTEQLNACEEAGMNDYITKPIDKDELIFKINKQLKINNL